MKYLINFLKTNKLTIATCESFTGGMFGDLLSNTPGVSEFYKGSFICYSNEFKENILQIDAQVIKKDGVVSRNVLREMLKQTQKILKTEIVFGFTGYAPPIDKNNKLSGLSYLGFLIKDQEYIFEFKITKNISRKTYKKRAINFILKKFKEI
ncbi:CinA family protein [Spiroplasma culicicola]|uniref:Competence damage-inducible protein A n=1 Tax=Spiroplasma culicicola AES-1 TaxID=1276246 RepID=W6A6P3_9MOLU|nr:CinA family protein [Spiroplasma culicicola]AHI52667.1 competence damage-inducible protein A [Spiroplasma culicicola AES-1]